MRCSLCHRRIGAVAGCPLHGGVAADASAAERAPVEAAPRVAGFDGLRLLDEGGFARVFAAVRRDDGRAVALKIARHRGDPRFPREAAALRRVGPPAVPRLLGEGEVEGGSPYLVLELLEGETLARWMAALPGAGAAAPAEVARLVEAIGAALDAVHAAGVVHRDLKPENVMLRRRAEPAAGGAGPTAGCAGPAAGCAGPAAGCAGPAAGCAGPAAGCAGPAAGVALLDLGLARLAEGGGGRAPGPPPTHTGLRLGSVMYMAPEQCLDARDVDARADLYSLAVVAFELLTGRPPFVGEPSTVVHAHVSRRPPRPSELAPIPRSVDEVLLRALAKARDERFGSARAFSEALRTALASAPARAPLRGSEGPAPDIEPPTPDIEPPTPDIEPPTSDIEPPTSDIEPPTSDIEPPTSDIEPPTSDIEPPTSDIEPPTSDIEPPTSDIEPPAPDIEPPTRDIEPSAPDIEKSISHIEKPMSEEKNPLRAVGDAPRGLGEPRSAPAASPAAPPQRRPVALLAIQSSAPIDRVVALAAPAGGRLARVQDGIYVLAFPGPPRPSVRAAVLSAQRLVAALQDGSSAAVHVGDLQVREGAAGMVFAGPALAQPARLFPPGATDPVAITPEAAALLDGAALLDDADGGGARAGAAPSEAPAADLPLRGRDELREAPAADLPLRGRDELLEAPAADLPLRGRDELLADLVAHARAAFRDGAPLLCALVGDVGHGKTRLLEAAAAALSAEPRARVLSVAARPPDVAEPAGLALALLRASLALAPGADARAVREACVARLGPELGLASWPAVAFAAGALPEADPAVAAVLAAPGALRQTLARAAGEALQRLARERPLALLVDDAQWGDQGGLDALEIATLSGARAPLAVLVAATPALSAMRPLFGERAARLVQRALPPLDAAAARALLLDRLHPVEFVPEPVVEGLLGAAQGVPLLLVELAAALRRAGAIRKVRGGPGWYLAGDEIALGGAGPVMERLARRALAGLPPPLAELAGVCAVAGDELTVHEIGDLVDEAARERVVTACGDLDPGVGLSRLARRGLLRFVDAGRLAFAHPLLREAIEAEVPEGTRRRLHGIALRRLCAAPGERSARLARIARHAAAAGAHAHAAAACFELAEGARRRHLYVDAERHYTAALAQIAARAEAEPASGRAVRKAAVLAGRGKVRYRIQRFDDAAGDLRAARALAEAEGDDALVADLLLDEATVLDWCGDYAGSQALVDRAAPLVARLGDAGLAVRCDVAAGRGHFRRQELEEAIARLEPAARQAEALGDHESHVIALLLLAPALVCARRVDEAEARFDEVIARCVRAGDRLHLGVATANRLAVRLVREDPDGAERDLRTAVALARELGSAFLERLATHNLAELLYWSGELAEALPLALRAWELQERFFEASLVPDYALLVARIHCARGELAEARRHLDWVLGHAELDALPPVTRALVRLCAQVVQGDDAPDALWDALVAEVREASMLSEHIEVLCFAAAAALRAGRLTAARRWLEEARAETAGSRFWSGRLARLAAELDARAPP